MCLRERACSCMKARQTVSTLRMPSLLTGHPGRVASSQPLSSGHTRWPAEYGRRPETYGYGILSGLRRDVTASQLLATSLLGNASSYRKTSPHRTSYSFRNMLETRRLPTHKADTSLLVSLEFCVTYRSVYKETKSRWYIPRPLREGRRLVML